MTFNTYILRDHRLELLKLRFNLLVYAALLIDLLLKLLQLRAQLPVRFHERLEVLHMMLDLAGEALHLPRMHLFLILLLLRVRIVDMLDSMACRTPDIPLLS